MTEIIELTQLRLLAIVRSWTPDKEPEFRNFRCGVCQIILPFMAWHYLLHEGGFLTPVHLCGRCNGNRDGSRVEIPKLRFDRNNFHPQAFQNAIPILDRISGKWDPATYCGWKGFSCDACELPFELSPEGVRAWHVWRNKDGTLTEYHFCQICFQNF
jgi:hypothetical protein